ncbi:MAG: PAS domain S-box protein [Halobacteriaceae archaeon]
MDPSERRPLLDSVPDALAVVTDDGTVRSATGDVKRSLGVTADALVGRRFYDDVHPVDRPRVQAALDGVTTGDDAERVEFRYGVDDAEWRWVEARASAAETADGDAVVTCRDVTERRAEGMDRLEQFAEHTDEVLWMVSGDWRECLFLSPAFEDVFGLARRRLDDDPTAFLDAVHPDDRDRTEAAMATLSGGDPIEIECRANPRRGFKRLVAVEGQPIVEDDRVVRIIGFARDVTDQRRREQHLRVMDRLLRHNLRNDLNVVLGRARLARDRGDEAVAASMDTVIETCEDLLATADKEREILAVLEDVDEPTALDFGAAVERAIETAADTHPEARIDVDLPRTSRVRALEEIEVAVTELVENAIRHAAADAPTVSVRVRDRGDRVQLTVRDEGPPISEHEFRALATDAERDDLHHGTGLGLWLVYWIVDLSEGKIDFSASESRGNVVTVRLRRAD